MITVFAELRKGNCRIVIGELLQFFWEHWENLMKVSKEQKYLFVVVLEEISKISGNLQGRARIGLLLL